MNVCKTDKISYHEISGGGHPLSFASSLAGKPSTTLTGPRGFWNVGASEMQQRQKSYFSSTNQNVKKWEESKTVCNFYLCKAPLIHKAILHKYTVVYGDEEDEQ